MSVKTISKDELRRMEGSEGLILQGCGGSLDEGPEPEGGLPSTILEPLPDGSCRVIREGAIPLAALASDGVDLRHTEESGLLRY